MRRGGEQQHNYILAFPSIHEMSPDRWIRELSWPKAGALYVRCRLHQKEIDIDSFDLSERIRLSINRFENSTFISLFVHFRHAHNNKKQAKQLEAKLLALEFLFTNELGKPTQRFDSDFVEPVLLLPARRVSPTPGTGRAKGLLFLKQTAMFC
ncbi:hypothetical protein VNO78_35166 [Psophocarpus tetragonolobus]|uniref:Uncharacterized protein n=1 Tax=Psophocarpus tetragonolobus TaxID=3891 RepID=A0AAN9NS16_PSOTE